MVLASILMLDSPAGSNRRRSRRPWDKAPTNPARMRRVRPDRVPVGHAASCNAPIAVCRGLGDMCYTSNVRPRDPALMPPRAEAAP
jgi:hypothetical protein